MSEFRVRVCLERYFSDERARCFMGVNGDERVRFLSRRLRRLFPELPRRFALLSEGHLLPPDEPLSLVRPDEVVHVVPISANLIEEGDMEINESTETPPPAEQPAPKRKKIRLSFSKRETKEDEAPPPAVQPASKKKMMRLSFFERGSKKDELAPSQHGISSIVNDPHCSQPPESNLIVKSSQNYEPEEECAPIAPQQTTEKSKEQKVRTNNNMLDTNFSKEKAQLASLEDISSFENKSDRSSLLDNNTTFDEASCIDELEEVKGRALALLDNAVAPRRRRRVRRRRRPQPGPIPEPAVTNEDKLEGSYPVQVNDHDTHNRHSPETQPAEDLLINHELEPNSEDISVNPSDGSNSQQQDPAINMLITVTEENSEVPMLESARSKSPDVVRNVSACPRAARIVRPLETTA